MAFNSLAFVAFLAIVLPAYFALGRLGSVRLQNLLLLVASYFFYGWWDWRFLPLLAVSTVVDYSVGLALQRRADRTETARGSKALLLVSLIANLGILGVFKYYDFFVESAVAALAAVGFEANLPLLQVILPVGISFYTFQTIAYTYSVYKGETRATEDLVAFGVYVAYFPQLVAGPIERASKLLPQILTPRRVTTDQLRSGGQLVLLGLFKKIAVADAAAGYVTAVYSDPGSATPLALLFGTYLFALQIYGDFSGYTDIARGVSRVMGIELILNFRQPYLATNITDFWRRWHISLSTWLREHLYIPLGGNRHGTLLTYRNLMLTMLLGGLWHGAGWAFVVWGGLHGLYLAVHKFWLGKQGRTADAPRGRLAQVIGIVVTFHLVCLAWVFFRAAAEANSMGVAWDVLTGIADVSAWGAGLAGAVPWTVMLLFPVVLWVDWACASRDRQAPVDGGTPLFVRGLVYGAAVTLMIVDPSPGVVEFLYFQF